MILKFKIPIFWLVIGFHLFTFVPSITSKIIRCDSTTSCGNKTECIANLKTNNTEGHICYKGTCSCLTGFSCYPSGLCLPTLCNATLTTPPQCTSTPHLTCNPDNNICECESGFQPQGRKCVLSDEISSGMMQTIILGSVMGFLILALVTFGLIYYQWKYQCCWFGRSKKIIKEICNANEERF